MAHTFKTSTWGSVSLMLAWFTKSLKRNKKKKRKKETKRRRKKKKVENGKQSQV